MPRVRRLIWLGAFAGIVYLYLRWRSQQAEDTHGPTYTPSAAPALDTGSAPSTPANPSGEATSGPRRVLTRVHRGSPPSSAPAALEQVDSPASASEPAPPSASISGEPLDLASLVAPGATGGPVDLAPLVGPEAAATEATFGGGLVNINTADYDSLVALPGIGPALARRIIAHREASGPFTAVDQLIDIPGIGSRNIDDFRHLVTV